MQASKNATFYASYSQGFRSGFAQDGAVLRNTSGLAPAIDPDRLYNYEIGSKGETQSGVLSYDIAVYYIDWKDAVQVVNRQLPGTNVGFFGAVNAESASGFGVDFASTVRLMERARMGATVSWNDLTFDQNVLTGGAVLYPKGSRLNESPELTVGGFLDYEVSLGSGYSGQFSGSLNYTSSMEFGAIPNLTKGDNLLTARAGFTVRSPRKWDATLFVDNLTDEDGALRFGAFVANTGDRFRPRTIGIQVNFRM